MGNCLKGVSCATCLDLLCNLNAVYCTAEQKKRQTEPPLAWIFAGCSPLCTYSYNKQKWPWKMSFKQRQSLQRLSPSNVPYAEWQKQGGLKFIGEVQEAQNSWVFQTAPAGLGCPYGTTDWFCPDCKLQGCQSGTGHQGASPTSTNRQDIKLVGVWK